MLHPANPLLGAVQLRGWRIAEDRLRWPAWHARPGGLPGLYDLLNRMPRWRYCRPAGTSASA
jgi:hypothetical protein